MNKYVCTTCGIQYPGSQEEPERCPICEEERQYVNPDGQSFTTLDEMIRSGVYQNTILQVEPGLYSITTTPKFGIGQTAYLITSEGYNVLWDCVTYLDEKTIRTIEELGGIDAIAVSHPHYYSAQLEWAERFDAPIYLHGDDQKWVMEPGRGDPVLGRGRVSIERRDFTAPPRRAFQRGSGPTLESGRGSVNGGYHSGRGGYGLGQLHVQLSESHSIACRESERNG
ncbi:MBL fold metallo-hydrolase [Rossellomorea aquimaris]|uniref:MBL fold metallo-hydrolase n=1 Tax=Rossellomorea aquimaris TaxID=189382 RepID=UPI0037C864A0